MNNFAFKLYSDIKRLFFNIFQVKKHTFGL